MKGRSQRASRRERSVFYHPRKGERQSVNDTSVPQTIRSREMYLFFLDVCMCLFVYYVYIMYTL